MSIRELLSQVYRALELRAADESSSRVERSEPLEISEVDINEHGSCTQINLIAIDAGLGRVQVGSSIFDVVQVVAVGRGVYFSKFFIRRSRPDLDSVELIQYVRLCELQVAYLLAQGGESVILLDGLLERCLQDARTLTSLTMLTSRNNIVVAVSKQIAPRVKLGKTASNKVKVIVLEKNIFGNFERRKIILESDIVSGLLAEIYSYRGAENEYLKQAIAAVHRLSLNSVSMGYPLPLLLSDYLSRLSLRELLSIRSIIERLRLTEQEIALPIRATRHDGKATYLS